METITLLIKNSSIYSPILPIAISFFLIAIGRFPRNQRLILGLLILALVTDQLSILAARLYGNNMPIFHTYIVLESIIIIKYLHEVIQRRFIIIFGAFLISFLLIDSIAIDNLLTFNTLGRLVQSLVLIALCIYFFYKLFIDEKVLNIEKNGIFWIIVGFLVYYAGAFFSFLLYEKLIAQNTYTSGLSIWIFHNAANTIKNLMFAYGIWTSRKA